MRFFLIILALITFQTHPGSQPSANEESFFLHNSDTKIRIADTTSVSYLMGRFNPAKHPEFKKIDRKHCTRENAYLRKEVYVAFKKMANEAAKAGIKLVILSSTRNFKEQKRIWEGKWYKLVYKEQNGGQPLSNLEKAKQILKFSSMPGTSRHHWGTDIDLNSLENAYFTRGQGKKEYQWLQANASRFGFCQPYTPKATGRTGYEEEKWHWSYQPLSDGFTLAAQKKLKDEMLKDFTGAETATQIKMVKTYVLGISSECSKE